MRFVRAGAALAAGLVSAAAAGVAQAQQSPPAAQPTTQPYVWRNVSIVAGGFVNGILFHPKQKGLIYARTDMGGAYRWDSSEKRWIPLTDWASQSDWNLRGIESIGLDPNDPQRLYIAAGTYTAPDVSNGVILRSDDQGRTFQRTDMPFKMGGNEDGRSAGERLAVDPNDGSVLYFGSREAGLWKSADRGATWSHVQTFPIKGPVSPVAADADAATSPAGGGAPPPPWRRAPKSIGITFVAFDPRSGGGNGSGGAHGQVSQTIYAGVASPEISLYRSVDGGATWAPIPGEPKGLLAHQGRIDADGTLYVTYDNAPGPNGITAGAVWKYDPQRSAWTDISPLPNGGGGGFSGITLGGPEQPQLLMVSTLDHWKPGDDLFRSVDGGKTWKPFRAKAVMDASLSPYLNWGRKKPSFGWWTGAVALDPYDPNHAMYGTGATIWETHDAENAERNRPTHWAVGAAGLEETAVIDLISPPAGAHLLSGLGDIGGFRHDDFAVSPPQQMYLHPEFDNTDCLDFAENVPSFVVRVGRGGDPQYHGAYSVDGGTTWTPFPSAPENSRGSGSVAVSADAGTILWAPAGGFGGFGGRPGGQPPAPSYTRDRGAKWTACDGLPQRARVIADRVDPNAFYAFDETSGTLYASADGGAHFAVRSSGLPTARYARLRSVPGAAGDLWLTTGGGLYHSTDRGAHFTRLTTVDKADAAGFGKAAPGGSYVALYLIGRVGGVDGFFRSDDAGATWVRINDDAHQYGLVGPIIGDPRIYGRVYLGTNGRGVLYADPEPATAQLRPGH